MFNQLSYDQIVLNAYLEEPLAIQLAALLESLRLIEQSSVPDIH